MPVIGVRRSKGARRQGGQAIAELALALPVLWLVLGGIIQSALLLGGQNGLVGATRDAARRIATLRVTQDSLFQRNHGAPGICDVVLPSVQSEISRALPGFEPARFVGESVVYTWHPNPDGTTWYVTIKVSSTYRHPLYIPIVAAIFDAIDGTPDSSFPLGASEEMRVENPVQPPPSGGSLEVTCS